MRNKEHEDRKDQAYIAGQNAGFANKPPYSANPFDRATQEAEYFAFLDGHEDGQALYEKSAALNAN